MQPETKLNQSDYQHILELIFLKNTPKKTICEMYSIGNEQLDIIIDTKWQELKQTGMVEYEGKLPSTPVRKLTVEQHQDMVMTIYRENMNRYSWAMQEIEDLAKTYKESGDKDKFFKCLNGIIKGIKLGEKTGDTYQYLFLNQDQTGDKEKQKDCTACMRDTTAKFSKFMCADCKAKLLASYQKDKPVPVDIPITEVTDVDFEEVEGD